VTLVWQRKRLEAHSSFVGDPLLTCEHFFFGRVEQLGRVCLVTSYGGMHLVMAGVNTYLRRLTDVEEHRSSAASYGVSTAIDLLCNVTKVPRLIF
jgi:hypothetical protein